MSNLHKVEPNHAHTIDPRVAESIAREMAMPVELVSRIYWEELQSLASEARIGQFLQVIAGRRARLRLRSRH